MLPRKSERQTKKTPLSSAEITERIWLAIAERRLRPGTRLKEEELAEIFEVSRARVRQALINLQREGLVTLQPNRGAFVSAPDIEEAMDVLYARKSIEQRVVERLAKVVTPEQIAQLCGHIAQERTASAHNRITDVIQLSGGFHNLLAEMLGSEFLSSILRDLVSRSSLITAIYRDSAHFNCGPDEHQAIVAALEKGDGAAAVAAMSEHLTHLEADLHLDRDHQVEPTLKNLLG